MERIMSRQQFQVSCESPQDDSAPDPQDKVTFVILGGTVSFVVPSDLPDAQLLDENWISRHAFSILKLENGAELRVWINEDTCSVDVRTHTQR